MHSNNTCEQRQKTNGTAIAGVPKYNFRFNGMGLPAIGAEGQPALPKRPAIAQVNPVPQPVRAKSKSKNKFIPATIPAELRKLPQWVCWRWDERNGKTTKVPVNPITGANASSTAPDDWTSFEAAVRAFQDSENYGGVGFVFTESDGFFGVDLDACYDSETKTLALWAAKIVNALDSYTEISPSGFGVKIVARGRLPPISRHVHKPKGVLRYGDKEPEIAIYDRARYWCLTGRRLKTRPETCEPRQAELETLLAELFPQATPQPANRPAVVRSLKPLNSLFERFLNDCAGAKNGQRSERDFALCAAAIREGWDRDEVWERVQHVGKFAEAGRRYFDLTCKSAEATVAADESVKSTTAETSVRSLARELDPRDVVQKYLQGKEYNGIPTIIFWQGSFYLWEHGKYSLVSDTEMRARLVQHINRLATKVTTSITSNHFEQFKAQALTASSIQPLGWLYEPPHDWPATDLVATRTHIVNLSLFTGGKPSSSYLDATPAFFTLNALDYDFSCTPPKPTEWLKFLHELWSTDPAAIETLQEWFGYCLTPDTRQQKMLLLVGPKRSGKGTIARVITELLGRNNVAGPTLSSLGGNFGLSTLLVLLP